MPRSLRPRSSATHSPNNTMYKIIEQCHKWPVSTFDLLLWSIWSHFQKLVQAFRVHHGLFWGFKRRWKKTQGFNKRSFAILGSIGFVQIALYPAGPRFDPLAKWTCWRFPELPALSRVLLYPWLLGSWISKGQLFIWTQWPVQVWRVIARTAKVRWHHASLSTHCWS